MHRRARLHWSLIVALSAAQLCACGDGNDENEAVNRGVGAACDTHDDCNEDGQSGLPFKDGYCGLRDCEADLDCPEESLCVEHDGDNHCFLRCGEKPECNVHREALEESNCVSSVV